MIISQTQQKHSTKFNIHSDKNSQQARNSQELPPLIKSIQKNLQLTSYLRVRLHALPLRSGQERRSALTVRPTGAGKKERKAEVTAGEEEMKLSLSADDQLIYAENLMESTLPGREIKVNVISTVSNEQPESEMKRKTPFIVT